MRKNKDTDALMNDARMGIEVESFVRSELGRVLISRAREQSMICVHELKKADPYNPQKIRDLQNSIWLADNFEIWMKELVIFGHNAVSELERIQDQENSSEMGYGEENE